MPFVAAKCTQCGATIEVDDTKEAGICKYCGTAFITEKAINNYNTYIITNNSFAGANINVVGGARKRAAYTVINSRRKRIIGVYFQSHDGEMFYKAVKK